MTVPHILTKICVKLIGHRRSRQTNRLKVMPQLMIQSQKDELEELASKAETTVQTTNHSFHSLIIFKLLLYI